MKISMKNVFVLIHLVLIALAAFLGVAFAYALLTGGQWTLERPSIPSVPLDRPASAPDTYRPSPRVLSRISDRNIFKVALEKKGDRQAPAAPLDRPVETLEKTRLDLTLLGTVILSPEGAYAVIQAGKAKKQEMFHTGDTLKGAEIRKILREKVVLRYQGKDEILAMEMKSLPGGALPAAAGPDMTAPAARSGEEVTLNRSTVNDALGNINKLMGDVRIRPHFSKGQPDGLLLYGIKKDSLFQEMGLRNGDIIMGVDGRQIQSVEDALSFYEQLKDASDVNVQIKRRGQTKEIQYHVE